MVDSAKLISIIANMWDTLPALVGDDWIEFETRLLVLLRQLEDEDEDKDDVIESIFILFKHYPEAHEKLFFARDLKMMAWKGTDIGVEPTRDDRKGYIKYERYVGVPVFYSTDRKYSGSTDSGWTYSGERGELSFGVVEISIPDDHRMGRLEKPRWWKLQFREDPTRDVVLLSIEKMDKDEFIIRSRDHLNKLDDRDALVFIHGYNCDFKEAAKRCAQISYDLNFEGLSLLYSWPSEGEPLKYFVDEENIRLTRKHFKEFLLMTLSQLGVETVHVIAHSMGNRILAETLSGIRESDLPDNSAKLRQVIFAAPDIDQETFIDLAKTFYSDVERYTLYASTKDLPLEASGLIHKYQRAGDSDPEVTIVETIDTIDASNVDASLMGHSYFGDNRSVITDILHLILNGLGPAKRGLAKCSVKGKTYWEFKK